MTGERTPDSDAESIEEADTSDSSFGQDDESRGFPWKRIVQALISLAIVAGIFLGVVLTIEGLFFLIQGARKPEERRVRRRLKTLSSGGYQKAEVNILRKTVLSGIPWFNNLLFKTVCSTAAFCILDFLLRVWPSAGDDLFSPFSSAALI